MGSKSSYALLWVLVAQASNASALPSHTAMTKPRSGLTTCRPRPSLSGLPAIAASRPSVRFQSVANRSCFNPPVLEGNSPGLAMLPSSYSFTHSVRFSSLTFLLPVESLTELVVRYHGASIHVDHAMSTGNQSVNGRRWNGGADGAVVQMEIHPMGF